MLDRVCSHCLYEKVPLKRCAACKKIQYCSEKCQSLSWKSTHKVECLMYQSLPGIPPTVVRGLMQLFIRKEIAATPNARWASLEGHESSLKKQKRWDEVVLQAKAAVEFMRSPANYLESAINVLCRLTTNAFRATLADGTPNGLCFEPTISLANHSCTPNAVIVFDGRAIELRALNDIKHDEQIFLSYIDATQSTEKRQDELQSRYFFTCKCEKCVNNDTAYATFLKTKPVAYPQLDLFVDPRDASTRGSSISRRGSKLETAPAATR